ncbi:MAG: bifunctional (p)ppGpp synthetase/guanosine-3',5'-bis(diphosphate) 3'-pyrophosphohydrolase [Bdellovibrionaceae bacterium]|nr:bifunctional (p)ppGpp synthetase/guanosine-3',5'-bis(diphosphate) 3'-pyrophosphohydrolase [Pseudobdellovibrionaceae bacterium]
MIEKAYQMAQKAHEGVVRRSGEEYITHPIGVAYILAQLKLDVASIIAALLHDTVEDTLITTEDILKVFGSSVAGIVEGVTKITKLNFRHTHEKQAENIRKMIVAMGSDVRVILVKLADRLHNMRTLNYMSFQKQGRIASETLDIYAPLASRLGMSSIKIELEDLSLKYAHPDEYHFLKEKTKERRKDRLSYVENFKLTLIKNLENRVDFSFDIQGRFKHLYSIYKKMKISNLPYEQIYDILAFRICVSSIKECYETLGIIHSLWRPIPGRFKDFIAMPKVNNYQSLHTTLIGNDGERVEVQIRTHEMHELAEWGIAAHWEYKANSYSQDVNSKNAPAADVAKKFNWLRELIQMNQETYNADEFLENMKSDLLESEIYVFTPKGEVKEFPVGATPIDFAYSIHTDVGNHIVSACVNKKVVPLRYVLQNGDTVEVVTSKNQAPSKDWLKFCVTSKAKGQIRTVIKKEQRIMSQKVGQDMLERFFRKKSQRLSRYTEGVSFTEYLQKQGCQKLEDLFVKIGFGRLESSLVYKDLVPKEEEQVKSTSEIETLEKKIETSNSTKKSKKDRSGVQVGGENDILVRFAKCCYPIPGDPIVGFVSVGRGISIHRADCEKTFNIDSGRYVEVNWDQKTENITHRVRLCIVSFNLPGILAKMGDVFSAADANIENLKASSTLDNRAVSYFDIRIKNLEDLQKLLIEIKKIKGIIQVSRDHRL